jgi:hypothetical protein
MPGSNPSISVIPPIKMDRFATVSMPIKLSKQIATTQRRAYGSATKRCSNLPFTDDCDREHESVLLHNNNLPRIFAAVQHLDTPGVLSEHLRKASGQRTSVRGQRWLGILVALSRDWSCNG